MAAFPNPTVGFSAFAVIKLAGYSYFGHRLNKFFGELWVPAFQFGFIRTIIGVLAGIFVAFITIQLLEATLAWFLILLIPVRFLEWKHTVKWQYRGIEALPNYINRISWIGIGYSFLLDVPVIASFFVIPGGMWIC